jgi:hypothetical protein
MIIYFAPLLKDRSKIQLKWIRDKNITTIESTEYQVKFDLQSKCKLHTRLYRYILQKRFFADVNCEDRGISVFITNVPDDELEHLNIDQKSRKEVIPEKVALYKGKFDYEYVFIIGHSITNHSMIIYLLTEDQNILDSVTNSLTFYPS